MCACMMCRTTPKNGDLRLSEKGTWVVEMSEVLLAP